MTFFEEKHCHINNKVIFFINITVLCIVHSKPTQLLCMHIRAITSYSKFEREKKKNISTGMTCSKSKFTAHIYQRMMITSFLVGPQFDNTTKADCLPTSDWMTLMRNRMWYTVLESKDIWRHWSRKAVSDGSNRFSSLLQNKVSSLIE